MRILPRAGALIALAFIAVTAGFTAAGAQPLGTPMTTPSGLTIIDTKIGTGAAPRTGQICVMHYTGWLYEKGAKGKKFEVRATAASRLNFRSAPIRSSPAGTKASRP